jgi:hypothetical protein
MNVGFVHRYVEHSKSTKHQSKNNDRSFH